MRTLTDLEGAFDLLDRHADAYAAAVATDETQPVELVVTRPRASQRRRRTVALLSAAAAVAALAAGATALTSSSGSGPQAPTAGGGSTETPAPRTFDVALGPSIGMTLLGVTAERQTALRFFSRSTEADIDILPDGPATKLTPGLEAVDINGHRAYYTDGSRPGFVQPREDPSTGAPPSPTPPDTRWAPAIVWRYSETAWLQILIQGSHPTRDDLLRVARAVRVGHKQSVRSAVRVDPVPAGLRLTAIDSLYHEPGDNPPYDLTGAPWNTLLNYERTNGRSIVVEATSVDITVDWHGGQSLTVGGHPAYWHPSRHQLDIDAGNGAYVDVRGGDSDTLADLLPLARATTVTPHPRTPSSWFDAKTELP